MFLCIWGVLTRVDLSYRGTFPFVGEVRLAVLTKLRERATCVGPSYLHSVIRGVVSNQANAYNLIDKEGNRPRVFTVLWLLNFM